MAGHRVEHHGFQCLRESMEEVCSIDMYLHAQIKIICPPSPPPCLNPGKGRGGGRRRWCGPGSPRRAVVASGRAQSLPAGWWRPGGSIGPGEGGAASPAPPPSRPAPRVPERPRLAVRGRRGRDWDRVGTGGGQRPPPGNPGDNPGKPGGNPGGEPAAGTERAPRACPRRAALRRGAGGCGGGGRCLSGPVPADRSRHRRDHGSRGDLAVGALIRSANPRSEPSAPSVCLVCPGV